MQKTYYRKRELVGIVFTCNGALSVHGPTAFKEHISKHKEIIWESLAFSTNVKQTKPIQDAKMNELLYSDLQQLTNDSLRKLLSWVTQKSVGRSRGFWGNEELRPAWWPEDIAFAGLTGKGNKCSKEMIMKTLNSYLTHEFANTIQNSGTSGISNNSAKKTSTPKKRSMSNSTSSPNKRARYDNSTLDIS